MELWTWEDLRPPRNSLYHGTTKKSTRNWIPSKIGFLDARCSAEGPGAAGPRAHGPRPRLLLHAKDHAPNVSPGHHASG